MKIKICDVVLNSIWYDPRVRKQIKAYNDKGYELTCIGLKDARFEEDKVNHISSVVKIVDLPAKYYGAQKSLLAKVKKELLINKLIYNAILKTRCDIIHANDLNALIPAYKASKKLKCKLIYDSHEIFVENFFTKSKQFFKKMFSWINRYYLYFQEKRIIKKVDLMVCVSNAAADYFEGKYKIRRPCVVTNCPIKSETVISENKHEGFEVLNHGLFYAGRGYDIMTKSLGFIKQFPSIKLVLRGFGSLENSLKEEVENNENKNQFIFYDRVQTDELVRYASFSHVGVAITEPICLNFKLSISNKIFEYAAAGLPVIMSNIPEHNYLNNKYNFGIVLQDNTPECFARAVIDLYTNKDLYNTLSLNSLKLSEELFWEKEFNKIIDFIEENKK